MRFKISSEIKKDGALALVAFQGEKKPVFSQRAKTYPETLLAQAWEDGFLAKSGETMISRPADRSPAEKILLLGAGKRGEADVNTLRTLGAVAVRRLADAQWPSLTVLLPEEISLASEAVQAFVEGAVLGAYRYEKYRNTKSNDSKLAEIYLLTQRSAAEQAQAGLARGLILAESVNFARDLINEPPSLKTPVTLGRIAQSLSGGPVRARVFDKRALQKMGMNALLGVNRGSAHPPVLVHLHYKPAGRIKKRLAFVGKGITFDSGGLSLKTADGMMTMKYDMAGAATVFSLFRALPRLKPAVEVHGLAPITENMPGQDAYKPGDVVRARNGKTIEVLNTDAEGRVVLADALSYAAELPVDEIIDVATLTGAATIALGKSYGALMSNNRDLEDRLRKAGDAAGEKYWPLPLEPGYRDHIKSKVADLKNIGNPGEAGTIIGGLFLEEFVAGKSWAHVDMASVGWSGTGTSMSPPGATGAVVRTFLNLILQSAL